MQHSLGTSENLLCYGETIVCSFHWMTNTKSRCLSLDFHSLLQSVGKEFWLVVTLHSKSEMMILPVHWKSFCRTKRSHFFNYHLRLDILLSFMMFWPLRICRWNRSCLCTQMVDRTTDWLTYICSGVPYVPVPQAQSWFAMCLPYCSISFMEKPCGKDNVRFEFGVPVDWSDVNTSRGKIWVYHLKV